MVGGGALVVLALCGAALIAAIALVRRLRRRPIQTLRAKLVGLLIGLVGVELAMLPAVFAMLFGDGSAFERWLVGAGYVGLTAYVIARLFPWREIEAMTADPDARLGDVLRRMRDDDG